MKPKYRFDIDQNTDEWIAEKVGKFSASSGSDLLMDKKTKGYSNLIRKITEERITGKPCENKWSGNSFTERGHELEPIANESFQMETFEDIKSVGVVDHNDWCLCSPDGLINDDGLIQIKCPIFSTQWDYLDEIEKAKEKKYEWKPPTNYYKQMQFELFVTQRDYNYFYSWHPNLKSICVKVLRDEEMIKEIELRLKEAISEVKQNINKLKK